MMQMQLNSNDTEKKLFSEKLLIVAGHYGTGKTNISVNMAVNAAKSGYKTSIVDLDIVNPYFRMADNAEYVKSFGVRPIVPEYANTNVDIPSLPKEFYSVFCGDEKSVIDVGGDDDGAVVLAAHRDKIVESGYKMVFVYNMYRPMISLAEDAAEMFSAIESVSGLKFCGIINNSNLGRETTAENVVYSIPVAKIIAEKIGVPLLFTTADRKLENIIEDASDIVYIDNVTKQLF